jgi:hypothetical protein
VIQNARCQTLAGAGLTGDDQGRERHIGKPPQHITHFTRRGTAASESGRRKSAAALSFLIVQSALGAGASRSA